MESKQLNFDDYKLPVVRIKMMLDKELYSNEPINSPEAAVLVMGIGTYLERARAAASSATAHNSSISVVVSQIDAALT